MGKHFNSVSHPRRLAVIAPPFGVRFPQCGNALTTETREIRWPALPQDVIHQRLASQPVGRWRSPERAFQTVRADMRCWMLASLPSALSLRGCLERGSRTMTASWTDHSR